LFASALRLPGYLKWRLDHLLATGTMGLVREAFIETHEDKIPALATATARLKAALAMYPQCRVHWDWV
jgi:hypothetical protein